MPKPTSPRSHGAAIQRAEAAPSLASAESRYVAKDNIVVSTGPMHTNNLFNCIAVVAYHEDSENAAFTHYDTIFAFGREPTGEEDEYGNDEYRSKLNVNALKQLKKDLLGKLNQTAGVDFYIVLGVVWKDERINQNEDDKRKKGELIEGLREVFNPVNMATGGTETAHWSRSDFASLL